MADLPNSVSLIGIRFVRVLHFDVISTVISPSFSAGSDVRVLVGHAGSVYCMTFNTDNSFLASGSEDGTGEMMYNSDKLAMYMYMYNVH
jgi:WD40 repeat protein